GWIERGEHPRVGHHTRAREPIEQRRLAGVGVAYQCYGRQGHGLPLAALDGAASANFLKIPPNGLDALMNAPAVGFEFGLARSAGPDSTAQPREFHAFTRQA